MTRKYLYLLLLMPFGAIAQQSLSLRNAIDTALKHNFDIQIAENNSTKASISNTFGNAGGLPTVGASVTNINSASTIHQEYSSGTTLDRDNVIGKSLSGALTLSIPLFNGFRVLATKQQLEALQAQGEYLLNAQIQNTMAAVMLKYYDLVRQQAYARVLQRSLEAATQKLSIVTNRKAVGMANDADLLQAQVDQSAIAQSLQSQQLVIEQTKTDLLVLMGQPQITAFEPSDSIQVDSSLQFASITAQLQKNPQYLAQNEQIRINETMLRQTNAQRYPSLRINTSYNASYVDNGAGTLIVNRSFGPQLGFTLQIPIYTGNQYKIQQNVAKYNVENARLQTQSMLTSINASAYKTFQSYTTLQQQMAEQEKSYQRSKQLLDLVMKRFALNMATSLEVKNAQTSYESAGYLLINLRYAAKSSEIELKRLVYQLK